MDNDIPGWVPLGNGAASRSVPASALYHDPEPLPPPPSSKQRSSQPASPQPAGAMRP